MSDEKPTKQSTNTQVALHTPWTFTPCEMDGGEIVSGAMLRRADGKPAFGVDCGDHLGFTNEEAAFVVCAVNCHADLLAAAKIAVDASLIDSDWPGIAELKAAIAKAEGR